MSASKVSLPLYSRLAFIVLGLLGFFYILFIGQDIIVPFVFATIIAILLNPIVNYLNSKSIHRVISIVIALLVAVVVVGALVYFIVSQAAQFSDSLPQFKQKFQELSDQAVQWASSTFNIGQDKIKDAIVKSKKSIDSMAIVTQALGALSGLAVLLIMPVFIFIILFYKPLFIEFITRLFKGDQQNVVEEVLTETKALIQNYLVGLSIEAAIVAVLNTVGLLILGIPYAMLLGIIGALLNVIPYVGIWVAGALTMLVAVASNSPSDALWVGVVYIVVQFIDNQIIVPRIVAGKVKINAFISILVVLIGGAIWGISGMFLAIPLTAIVKVIFDRVEALKPFGYLLGDEQPVASPSDEHKRRKKSSK